MNYKFYGLTDFLEDSDFKEWVISPTQVTDAFWNEFMLCHPEKVEIIENAISIVKALSEDMEESMPDEDQVKTMWENIQGSFESSARPTRSIWPLLYILTASAAVIVLMIGWFLKPSQKDSRMSYHMLTSASENILIEQKNATSKPIAINLPDGSQIMLEPNSSISYPKDFNAKKDREIYLSGQAFFNVQKNKARPFLVYSNELVTMVLGTSFTIKAFENTQQVEVEVKTGKVSVFKRNSENGASNENAACAGATVITPNQKILYSRNNEVIQKFLVETPEMIVSSSALPAITDFEDAPVTTIFKNLEDAYGIDIVFDENLFSRCLLTASFSHESLYDKIDLICKGVEAEFSVVDAKIVISGRGCH